MQLLRCFCVIFTFAAVVHSKRPPTLYEHSPCNNTDGRPGLCTQAPRCPEYDVLPLKRCNIIDDIEIVCCPMAGHPSLPPGPRKSELACANYTSSVKARLGPQIFGGRNAAPGEYPYMAALGFYSEMLKLYRFRCGGIIVSERFVMTATHCLDNREEEEVKIVRLGVIDVPESDSEMNPATDYKVKRVVGHPKYNSWYEFNDIALVELEEPLKFSDNLTAACLYTNETKYAEEFVVIGWGYINERLERSSILQAADVSLTQLDHCKAMHSEFNKDGGQLCAVGNKGDKLTDTCLGDSGGPLIMKKAEAPILVGITSYGQPGCYGGRPSVYTSISQYIDWIEGIVWKNDV